MAVASLAALSSGSPSQLQHVGDVLHVLGAGLLGCVSGAEIVVAFRQAQAALVGHRDLLAGILEVLLFAKAHERVGGDQLEAGEQFGQLVFAFERGDAIELRLQRFQSLLVDGVHIHAGGIGVADLLLIRSAAGAASGGFFQHGVQDVFGVIGNHGAGAVSGTIVRNRIQLGKIAAGVLEEIGAGIGGSVDQPLVQAR